MSSVVRRGTVRAMVTVLAALGGSLFVHAQDGQPTFRAGIDLIPIDVQIVGKDGNPVADLDAAQFEVTVDGKKRRVVSADFVDYRTVVSGPASAVSSSVQGARVAEKATQPGPPRIFVLAVDATTLDAGVTASVLRGAADFIAKLSPRDEVGLLTYPTGPAVDPTSDHDQVLRALSKIAGHRDPPYGEFKLSPTEIIEGQGSAQSQAGDLIESLCHKDGDPNGPDSQCADRLRAEINAQVLFSEGVTQASIGTLRSLFLALAPVDTRKTVVMLTGGLLSSDDPRARPDVSALAMQLGETAARSNVNLYSLYVDQVSLVTDTAQVARARGIKRSRDRDLMSAAPALMATSSGGDLVRVDSGNAGPAFDRILKETSSYYLLGVESTPQDLDGRPRQLKVQVRDRAASVRGRAWLVVPKRGTPRPPAANSTPAVAETTISTRPPVGTPVAPDVRTLADAFDRDDRTTLSRAMAEVHADDVLRRFRDGGLPWPAAPRRAAAFALDLALAGLQAESRFTKEEAARLLGEYTIRVRAENVNDAFECAWLRTAVAGLEGLFNPLTSTPFAERAIERCPADSRLRLAVAVVRDQQMAIGVAPREAGAAAVPVDEGERRILDAYTAAFSGSTEHEARLRAAWLQFRAGRFTDALALIDAAKGEPPDAPVRYLRDLVRGQILRSLGRLDDAAASFRLALDTWPRAQSARAALMTLLVARGQFEDAAALAESIQTADAADNDPWWVYWIGDGRQFTMTRAALREVLQ
ncbi:MAG: VWA domain-containing protein [Acidobacteriota bacterium]